MTVAASSSDTSLCFVKTCQATAHISIHDARQDDGALLRATLLSRADQRAHEHVGASCSDRRQSAIRALHSGSILTKMLKPACIFE